MKIKLFLLMMLIIVIFLIIIAAAAYYFIDENNPSAEAKFIPICFSEKCFNAELAISLPKLMKGLMFRKELAADAGMLFVFSTESKHAFWMKNTLIPLDIIWINADKEIVFIASNVQPCKALISCPSVSSDKPAKYVLEINAGKAGEIGLKMGDKAVFDLR